MSVRVVIVEDHALTRAGLRTALSHEFEVLEEAADGHAGLAAIGRHRPDVAIVDLGLPGMDGIELTHAAASIAPETRVVILTMSDEENAVLAALAAGADGYCLKSSVLERTLDAVRLVAGGSAYFDPQIADIVLARFGPRAVEHVKSPLTQRESDVLLLIAEGVGNAEIAERLHIGLGTVKGHVRDILEKLAAADRTQAAVTALRRGYI